MNADGRAFRSLFFIGIPIFHRLRSIGWGYRRGEAVAENCNLSRRPGLRRSVLRPAWARLNFKGIVAISGFQGSLKYETAPFFLALDALASTIGHNGGVLKSSVYESMDRWPGFLGLYATNDFETADGAIEEFNNRLRGFKEIRMVIG